MPKFVEKWYKNENAQRALKEIGLSASGFCSESNPSPGSRISLPVFGYELFVAQLKDVTIHGGSNRKLFTIYSPILMGRRHRVICHWFDSNPGLKLPR
jgi:hypothetical protein